MTTIKVSGELRDRLKEYAGEAGLTLGSYLEKLLAREERERRFAQLRDEIARTSPEDMASYRAETEWWDAVENG